LVEVKPADAISCGRDGELDLELRVADDGRSSPP
jgi:hypothetical protein